MNPHCENCGKENPQTHDTDSYTTCCNELVCPGPQPAGLYNSAWNGNEWGNDKVENVTACCGHYACEAFIARDGEVPATFSLQS